MDLSDYLKVAQSGDEAAFEHLYYSSIEKVRAACFSVLKNPADVDDAIQETYIKIYRQAAYPVRTGQVRRVGLHDCAQHQPGSSKEEDLPHQE